MKTTIGGTLVKFQRYYDKGLLYVFFAIPIILAILDFLLPAPRRGSLLIYPILATSPFFGYLKERKLHQMVGSIGMAYGTACVFVVKNFNPPTYMTIILILIIACFLYAIWVVRPEPQSMNRDANSVIQARRVKSGEKARNSSHGNRPWLGCLWPYPRPKNC